MGSTRLPRKVCAQNKTPGWTMTLSAKLRCLLAPFPGSGLYPVNHQRHALAARLEGRGLAHPIAGLRKGLTAA